jgi:hypothetical protein
MSRTPKTLESDIPVLTAENARSSMPEHSAQFLETFRKLHHQLNNMINSSARLGHSEITYHIPAEVHVASYGNDELFMGLANALRDVFETRGHFRFTLLPDKTAIKIGW